MTLETGVRVVFPLLRVGTVARGKQARLVSTAFGCYGGPIADGPIEPEDLVRVFDARALGRPGHLRVLENPVAPPSPRSASPERETFTDVLLLTPDVDAVFARFSKGRRYEIKRGKASGVSTRLASSLDDYRGYYGAYEDSLGRWGERATSRYPWDLFEAGYRLAQQYPENIRLWLAEVDARVVAGAWVFSWNRHAVYWHGAAYRDAFRLSANSVVLADAIADACTRELEWFDFNPSGGHAGVADYKKQFGPERRAIRVLSYERPGLRRARALRRVLS
jgi:hypothetical protein